MSQGGTAQEEALEAFGEDVAALGRRLRGAAGMEDLRHLRRIECAGRLADAVGLGTCWLAPNPVSAGLLAVAMMARFMIGHQVMHGGYDGIPGVPCRHTRRGFARGLRLLVDWPDWWNLAEWRHTHHRLHHAHTQAPGDADVMDSRNLLHLPMWQRVMALAAIMASWKFTYYAPRLRRDAGRLGSRRGRGAATYVLIRFVVPAGLALGIGWWASFSALVNLLLAELLHGIHSFSVIRPSHCGSDIPLFLAPYRSRAEFYLQGVLGTVNYRPTGDLGGLMLGWQNYQIEHHLFPAATLLQYRRAAPELEAICRDHGVPYRAEPLGRRFRKMALLFLNVEHQTTIDTGDQGGLRRPA